MITIKSLIIKNFMSIGNAAQVVNFDRKDLTLVLGENLDLGGDGSKNGVGKTGLINALSYAFYGAGISDIRVGNLINKTNDKNMMVCVEFDVDDVNYKIERGRKPNILRFFKANSEINKPEDNTARGENKETQKEIETLIRLSHDMFKHTVGLNTYTTPFLSLRVSDQRIIIEQLLGITTLSEKADKLKEVLKVTKDDIKEEEFRLAALVKSNIHIEDQIGKLKNRQRLWTLSKEKSTTDLALAIESLMDLDVDSEILIHEKNAEAVVSANLANNTAIAAAEVTNSETKREFDKEKSLRLTYSSAVRECNKWITQLSATHGTITRRMAALETDIKLIEDHKCHSCGQDLHDDKQEENKIAKVADLDNLKVRLSTNETDTQEHETKLADLGPALPDLADIELVEADITIADVTDTFYTEISEARDHQSTLNTLSVQLETAVADTDPFNEQIIEMEETGIQEVLYDNMNTMTDLKDHQTFLLNLLTKKDSFIRRKIIEQNLSYLNGRLTHYLYEIGLPHTVQFMPDLSVEISEMGRELDFDNLSRGERTRLVLSLSWAFRDVFESLYTPINLLFVDELVDSGLDASGVDAALKIMKGFARERGKSVWLVSHKDELISRVDNILNVVKTGGFTEYHDTIEKIS